MGVISDIKYLKPKVKKALEVYPHLRDNDNRLVANIWYNEIPTNCLTSKDLLGLIAGGKLTSSDSITRCRRKIQEENPYLRGKKYNERKNHSKEVRREINNN